jgi:DNA-binding LacI/PurR family transcriptional regulator
VLQAADQLNYYPNAIAKNFALKRSGNLGVVLPFVPNIRIFSTYYFSEILSGIGIEVKKRGYDLLLLFRQPDEITDYSLLFKTQKIDACIVLGARDRPEEKEAFHDLTSNKFPFCLLNQHYEGEQFNEIDADHLNGSYLAVKHLIDQGYRNIAFLNGPLDYSNSFDRLQGYRKALVEGNIPIRDSYIFEGNYSRTSGYAAVKHILPHIEEIDSIFVANDRMATGLIQGLREYDYIVGRDIAVIGYDNSDAATLSVPTLTTVQVPFYEMGRMAASRLLDQLIEGDKPVFFHEKLPTQLVVRESSIKKKNEKVD